MSIAFLGKKCLCFTGILFSFVPAEIPDDNNYLTLVRLFFNFPHSCFVFLSGSQDPASSVSLLMYVLQFLCLEYKEEAGTIAL